MTRHHLPFRLQKANTVSAAASPREVDSFVPLVRLMDLVLNRKKMAPPLFLSFFASLLLISGERI